MSEIISKTSDTISIKKLVLEHEGEQISVFLNNPQIYLHTDKNDQSDKINKEFKSECKVRLALLMKKLKGFRKLKAMIKARKIDKKDCQLIHFVRGIDSEDNEKMAFESSVTILDFLVEYCKEFNAYDTLEDCLNELGKMLIKYIPNLLVSKDVKIAIDTSNGPFKFKWIKGYNIDLIQRIQV